MPDLSIDCPFCGEANVLPIESDQESFTCASCGETATIDQAVQTGTERKPDQLVGEVISDCKVLSKVGEGGFGSVYKATDQSLQRTVALKVMLPSLTTNVEFVQKFLREAVTAAQLNHPNIVGIHKVGKDERRGIHYLIMEFVEGRTLADVVKEKGIFTWQEILPVMLQACDALAAAHARNIVHRDIKPENLMVDAAGVVKITDFGLAKSLSSDHKTTKVMGTPHYMSPEQFEGSQVDGRSDIYSLGVTFYYLLSKSRPYEGQNTVQIIYSILTQQAKPLPELNPDVPPALWAVIEKMISKKPEDRYQSLRDAITDLRKIQAVAQEERAGCAQCGTRNPKGRKFCRSCGAPLVVPCPACGSPEAAGTKTCSGCGADVDRLVRVAKSLESAKRFQALGDLRRAAETYRQVLALDATHAEAKAEADRLGTTLEEVERVSHETQAMMRTGAIESALSKVENLLRRYPTANEVRQQRDELRKALADRKVNRLVEDAEALAAQGKLRETMECLDQALRVDPGREDIRALRAEHGRRVAEAAESRQKAAEALAAGRYEEAFHLASEVLKVLPGDAAMEDLRRKAQSSVESVDQFLARGQEKLAAKRYGDALGEFEAALSLRPSDSRILQQVERARKKIAEQRERIAHARRQMADRQFQEAVGILRGVLEETPDDLEAKSLLTSCERGVQEVERVAAIERSLAEAGRLEAAGDTAHALEQLEQVVRLDPDNEVARTRREQIERKFREEKALRELADEHLSDGLFADAVESLQRLKSVNPARGANLDREIQDAKRRDTQVRGSLDRAEQALGAREYRRAAEAAQNVLNLAPKHPRALAIRKDADKAVAAIDRFLAECDRFLAAEMFDEALDSLDKARERGATSEEYKHRREACEQGRLALLKTDATRSLIIRDFEAAIAAYENVLEVRNDDSDALEGKRRAERRLRILTTEPLSLRLGTAAIVVVSLGLLQLSAIAMTREARVEAKAVAAAGQAESLVVARDTRKLEPDFREAQRAEEAGDWAAARAAYQREIDDPALVGYREDPRLRAGVAFADAIVAAEGGASPSAQLELLAAASAAAGDVADLRRAREAAVASLRDAAVATLAADAEAMEAKDPAAAYSAYRWLLEHPVAGRSPEAERIKSLMDYMRALAAAQIQEKADDWRGAAHSYDRARDALPGDAARVRLVADRLERLRKDWLESLRKLARDPATDDDRFYDVLVKDLQDGVRVFRTEREKLLQEFDPEREFRRGR